jgi:hypothetical protein
VWPETYASCLRSDTARARTLNDQGSLEVGNAGEHGQDHAPGRCCRISPRFGYRTKTRPSVLYALCDFQKVAGGSGQAVQARDRYHVTDTQVIE